MKKTTPFILLLIFVFSCTSNTIYKKPDDLISEDLMVDLILDIQIANEAKNNKNSQEKRILNYMPLVYKKYGIDSTRFARSNFYYTTDIDDYTKLLKRVQAKLELMEKEYEHLINVQDSLHPNKNRKPLKENHSKGAMIE